MTTEKQRRDARMALASRKWKREATKLIRSLPTENLSYDAGFGVLHFIAGCLLQRLGAYPVRMSHHRLISNYNDSYVDGRIDAKCLIEKIRSLPETCDEEFLNDPKNV